LVVVDQDGQEHAVITYGWMPRSFYFQSVDDNEVIEFDEDLPELTLGYLEPLDDQTENSPFFLNCFFTYFKDDPLFREWLERRYRLFKEAALPKAIKQLLLSLFQRNKLNQIFVGCSPVHWDWQPQLFIFTEVWR